LSFRGFLLQLRTSQFLGIQDFGIKTDLLKNIKKLSYFCATLKTSKIDFHWCWNEFSPWVEI